MAPSGECLRDEDLVLLIGAMVCLLAACLPRVQLRPIRMQPIYNDIEIKTNSCILGY